MLLYIQKSTALMAPRLHPLVMIKEEVSWRWVWSTGGNILTREN